MFLLMILFAGCISTYRITRPELVHQMREGYEPDLNSLNIAEPGDVMYMEFRFRVNPSVRLKTNLESRYGNVSSNVRLSKMIKDGKEVYGTISITGESITYLSDENDNGEFDNIMVQARRGATNWRDLETSVPYEEAPGIKSETGGFERELVFVGIKDDRIEVIYREYSDDLIVPSIEETIYFKPERDGTALIEYLGAKIEVISAMDDKLKYKIKKGFEQQAPSL
ncbi:MAG: hypothetical protein ACFCU6_01730 [Balneolaceae bacterium]